MCWCSFFLFAISYDCFVKACVALPGFVCDLWFVLFVFSSVCVLCLLADVRSLVVVFQCFCLYLLPFIGIPPFVLCLIVLWFVLSSWLMYVVSRSVVLFFVLMGVLCSVLCDISFVFWGWGRSSSFKNVLAFLSVFSEGLFGLS